MLDNIVQMLFPLALQRLSEIPVNEKRAISWYVMLLTQAYYSDDRAQFDEYLKPVPLPDNIKIQLAKALWNNDNPVKSK